MRSVLRNLIFTIMLTSLFFFGGVNHMVQPGRVEAHSDVEVNLPDTSAESWDTVAIPVIVSDVTGEGIYSFQCPWWSPLTFDSSVLTADSAYTTSTIAEGWFFEYACAPGQISFGAYNSYPLSGSGPLVYIVFLVHGVPGDTTTIRFGEMWLNETPPDVTTDGLFTISSGTDVGGEDEFSDRPAEFMLFQNYPNPFNPATVIQYALPHECEVEITVYNISGQKIKTLVKHKEETGCRQVRWDGRNDEGKQVASGIYFYRLKAGEFTLTRRMLLLR